MEPKSNKYGPGYRSGRIRVAMSRGNRALICNGTDMGTKHVESGVVVGIDDHLNIKSRTVGWTSRQEWNSKFHNYTLIWTPGTILLSLFFASDIYSGVQVLEVFSNFLLLFIHTCMHIHRHTYTQTHAWVITHILNSAYVLFSIYKIEPLQSTLLNTSIQTTDEY